MTLSYRPLAFTIFALASFITVAQAQDEPNASKAASPPQDVIQAKPVIPLRVQIVISRYQGDRKISSLPYLLAVNANDGVIRRDGTYVPYGGGVRLRAGGELAVPSAVGPSMSMRRVGTNIDCAAQSLDNGRFRISISIEDTSVYSEGQTATGSQTTAGTPSVRTFQSTNNVILRDGQTSPFTAAADKISGEVTRVEVTMNVEK